MAQKLILRKRDGQMIRCETNTHFSSSLRELKVIGTDGGIRSVPLNDLKAVFFVQDFEGNPAYRPTSEYSEESPKAGKSVTVTFPDGEILRGRVLSIPEGGAGFFLFPADPLENNEKVFVVRAPDVVVEVDE
ncbi:MAG: hypothetical protein P8Z49_00390 [Acidobacteriota bacterium]